jgi:hypothetical protein
MVILAAVLAIGCVESEVRDPLHSEWGNAGEGCFDHRRACEHLRSCNDASPLCRRVATIIIRCAGIVPRRVMLVHRRKVVRSYPPLHRYRATLVVCQSLCAVSNAYSGEGCGCGIIERTNACARSRWLIFVQTGGGYYPPLYRYCATSSNAGSSQPQHGH